MTVEKISDGENSPRMTWSSEQNRSFMSAISHLGGEERATPKSILRLMDNRDGLLTTDNIKSHLQVYRNRLRKLRAEALVGGCDNFESNEEQIYMGTSNNVAMVHRVENEWRIPHFYIYVKDIWQKSTATQDGVMENEIGEMNTEDKSKMESSVADWGTTLNLGLIGTSTTFDDQDK